MLASLIFLYLHGSFSADLSEEARMQCIKILGTPSGGAPKWVREAWIGLVLPLDQHWPQSNMARDVLTKTPRQIRGYNVDAVLAVEILSFRHPEAARWWRENTTLIQPGNHLVFSADDEIELVEGAPSIAPHHGKSNSGITIDKFLDRVSEIVPGASTPLCGILIEFRETWDEVVRFAMTKPAAIILSSIAAAYVTKCLDYSSSEKEFTRLHKEGHDFLQAFYRVAIECGINVTLEEIDRPLCYTDIGVQDGTIEISDGKVKLTERGERIVEDIKRRDTAPNN